LKEAPGVKSRGVVAQGGTAVAQQKKKVLLKGKAKKVNASFPPSPFERGIGPPKRASTSGGKAIIGRDDKGRKRIHIKGSGVWIWGLKKKGEMEGPFKKGGEEKTACPPNGIRGNRRRKVLRSKKGQGLLGGDGHPGRIGGRPGGVFHESGKKKTRMSNGGGGGAGEESLTRKKTTLPPVPKIKKKKGERFWRSCTRKRKRS